MNCMHCISFTCIAYQLESKNGEMEAKRKLNNISFLLIFIFSLSNKYPSYNQEIGYSVIIIQELSLILRKYSSLSMAVSTDSQHYLTFIFLTMISFCSTLTLNIHIFTYININQNADLFNFKERTHFYCL